MTNLAAWKEQAAAEDIAALHQTSYAGCQVCPAGESGFCSKHPDRHKINDKLNKSDPKSVIYCEKIFIEWANLPAD